MQPMTILLIEDEPVIALELELELTQAGHRVLMAPDAATALQLCATQLPDLAILNFFYAPCPDGMELAHSLRTRFCLPVMFVTGANWKNMEASAFFYAGHEVLHKPFTKPQLRAALQAVWKEIAAAKAAHTGLLEG